MTAQLSRERLEEIASLPLKTTSCGLQHAPGAYSTVYSHEIVEMASMLLAGMDSEPVAYIFKHPSGKLFWALTDESNKGRKDVMPVYAAPPAPVVVPFFVPPAIEPDYEVIKGILPTANPDEYACCIAADMWNACRAAMLKAGPVTGWIKCCERMPPSKTAVIVGCWFGRNWATKWATYLPSHEDAQKSGFLMPGGSWTPTHWMPLPAAPEQEV